VPLVCRVIVLLSERCGRLAPEPAEMLADDPVDLLVTLATSPSREHEQTTSIILI
jgi:hypothetical protein